MKRALGLALLTCVACRGNDGALAGASSEARPQSTQEEAPVAPSPFDAQGHLLGSGIRIDWLEIPRGFTARPKGVNNDSVFAGVPGIPASSVREFLLPQMMTGSAEELGEGVMYRGVMPHDGRADAMRFDVAVLAAKGGVLLRISAASFPNVTAIPEAEARKVLAKETRQAE